MIYLSPSLLDSFSYYQRSRDEYADKSRRELIDRLNGIRVTTESMQKGIDFENLLCAYMDNAVSLDEGHPLFSIVEEMAGYVRGGVRQVHVQTQILPEVTVHGYLDFLNGQTIYDVKTGSRYEFPKYLHNCQHLVYMAALKDSGITTFKYLVTDFSSVFVEEYQWQDSMMDELRGRANDFFSYLEIDPEMKEAFHRKAVRNARRYAA